MGRRKQSSTRTRIMHRPSYALATFACLLFVLMSPDFNLMTSGQQQQQQQLQSQPINIDYNSPIKQLANFNYHNRKQSRSVANQRIGLAPHDRPACQLPIVGPSSASLSARRGNNNNNNQHQPSTVVDWEQQLKQQQQLQNNTNTNSNEQQQANHLSSDLAYMLNTNQNKDSANININTKRPTKDDSKKAPIETLERLRQLRQLLVTNNYDAYLVTPNDEHDSEYVSEYDRRLRFISGFTGSNGYALIMLDRAVLFTDGRYALQADQELDCNWWLVVGGDSLDDIGLWLKINAAKGLKVATDARFMSLQTFDYLDEQLRKLDSEFVLISQDLIDIVWQNFQLLIGPGNESISQQQLIARPRPNGLLFPHPIEFAGNISWPDKLVRLSDSMQKLNARHYVIAQLDDIAWLLNLRGSDIPLTPLFKAYLLISRQQMSSSSSSNEISGAATAADANEHSAINLQSAPGGPLSTLMGGGGVSAPNAFATTYSTYATTSSSSASLNHRTNPTATATTPTTPPTGPLIDNLINTNQGQYQQQQQSSPQIVRVVANQLIKVTLYVNLHKIGQQVRDHLHLDNATELTITTLRPMAGSIATNPAFGLQSSSEQLMMMKKHTLAASNAAHASARQQEKLITRIQVELRDYDSFIMDFREKFSANSVHTNSAAAAAAVPSTNHQQIVSSTNSNQENLIHSSPVGIGAGGKLLLDASANVAIHVLAKSYTDERLILIEPLITKLKSIKSDAEVNGMRQAHWRDSLAISMLFAQLERDINQLKLVNKWTEISAARELELLRSLMDYNRGQSFETISAYGPNGAIVHYKPDASAPFSKQRLIGNDSTYLLDSGGQYLDGTTDITRTVHFGQPTNWQRETYTRVLMGSIDMMSLVFPASDRSSFKLNDLMARRHLFDLGLDYSHGTGHGIGLFSLVHEQPALIEHYALGGSSSSATNSINLNKWSATSISTATTTNNQQQQQQQPKPKLIHSEPIGLQANMFSSVEPGYYKANDFGIRLENIIVTQLVDRFSQQQPAADNKPTGGDDASSSSRWLRMEPISLVPFEPKLIKFELLSNKQKAWLNSYNLMVRLRMTQQINYYLTKIRQARAASGGGPANSKRGAITMNLNEQNLESNQIQIVGLASSSRLYRQLQKQQHHTSALINQTTTIDNSQQQETNSDLAGGGGINNFQRLEGENLQQLLELAHKWIMLKTELIPLDVPQKSLINSRAKSPGAGDAVSSGSSSFNSKFTRTNLASAESSGRVESSGSIGADEWSSLNSDPTGQRLMLSYMSSYPFNNQEAGQAADSLAGRDSTLDADQQSQQQQTDDSKLLASDASSSSSSATPFKCTSGIECDLWLLDMLNSRPSSMANDRNSPKGAQGDHDHQLFSAPSRRRAAGGGDQSPAADGPSGSPAHLLSQLMGLFQLNESLSESSSSKLMAGLWPLAAFGMVLALQVAVMAYVCQGRPRAPEVDVASAAALEAAANQTTRRRPSACTGPLTLDGRRLASFSSIGSSSLTSGHQIRNQQQQQQQQQIQMDQLTQQQLSQAQQQQQLLVGPAAHLQQANI